MAANRNIGVMTIGSVLEDFFQKNRTTPGFQGVDSGLRRVNGKRNGSTILRLHLDHREFSRRYANKSSGMETFRGIPVQVVRGKYDAIARTAEGPRASQYLTSGDACAGVGGGGQIALAVVERATKRISLLSAWSAIAGKSTGLGAWVYERPNPPLNERPIGRVTSTRLGRFGSVAMFEPEPDRSWLPIVRPGNQSITALKMPAVGEVLRVGRSTGIVEGKGIFPIHHEVAPGVWKTFVMEGVRLITNAPVAAGALAYHEATSTGAAMVMAFDQRSDQNVAIACKLPQVFADLGIRLAEYDDLLAPPGLPTVHAFASQGGACLEDPRETAGGLVEADVRLDAIKENRRADIATIVWPVLQMALVQSGFDPVRITDRVERINPFGGAANDIARAVAASPELKRMGITSARPSAFRGLATFDQVCERLNDLIESGAN